MNFSCDEKMNYIIEFVDYSITRFIDEVLGDSETDPEFSTVTLNNTHSMLHLLFRANQM